MTPKMFLHLLFCNLCVERRSGSWMPCRNTAPHQMQSATLQPEPQRGLARGLSAASEREAISACAETLQWRWAVGLYAEGERRGEDHGGEEHRVSKSVHSSVGNSERTWPDVASGKCSGLCGGTRSILEGSVRALTGICSPSMPERQLQPCRWPSTSRTTFKAPCSEPSEADSLA